MSMMTGLLGKWADLSPKTKRITVVGCAGAVLLSAFGMGVGGAGDSGPKSRQEKIVHVLTDEDTRDVGIDSLIADVKLLDRKVDELERENNRLRQGLDFTKDAVGNKGNVGLILRDMQADITQLKKDKEQLEFMLDMNQRTAAFSSDSNAAPDTVVEADPTASGDSPDAADSVQAIEEEIPAPSQDAMDFFRNADLPPSTTGPLPAGANPSGAGNEAPKPHMQISSFTEVVPEEEIDPSKQKEESFYLPTGAILTGVLINGMDAPTSNGARKDPFPSTLRIQKEAILPNRFRADIRECFLILGGYGDLSAERAYLRSETLSCVREDGGVIEASLDGYAVGEDGKAGVRGRLVSKQGQMIARSMVAGFMGAAAQAFDVNPVPVVNTDPGSSTDYQQVWSSDALQGAAAKGASNALDRVAQFYVDMAENIFPVIEVDAGRQVEIIVTKGTKLQVRSQGSQGGEA